MASTRLVVPIAKSLSVDRLADNREVVAHILLHVDQMILISLALPCAHDAVFLLREFAGGVTLPQGPAQVLVRESKAMSYLMCPGVGAHLRVIDLSIARPIRE